LKLSVIANELCIGGKNENGDIPMVMAFNPQLDTRWYCIDRIPLPFVQWSKVNGGEPPLQMYVRQPSQPHFHFDDGGQDDDLIIVQRGQHNPSMIKMYVRSLSSLLKPASHRSSLLRAMHAAGAGTARGMINGMKGDDIDATLSSSRRRQYEYMIQLQWTISTVMHMVGNRRYIH
jgi:hypothetical protein